MSIDLASAHLVSEREDRGRVVHIHDENNEPAYDPPGDDTGKPVTVKITGTYSKRYRKAQDAQVKQMITMRRAKLSTEQLAKNRIELVAECILEWDGFTNKGEPFPFTKENAVLLLTQCEWIRSQLEEAQNDHEGFSKSA